jgi:hypothetical protein
MAMVMLPSFVPPPTSNSAGSYKLLSVLPCRDMPTSRKSTSGAGRVYVLEGDCLNLSDEIASCCSALRTGKSDRSREGTVTSKPVVGGAENPHNGSPAYLIVAMLRYDPAHWRKSVVQEHL